MKQLISFLLICGMLFVGTKAEAQVPKIDAPESASDTSNVISKVEDWVKGAQDYVANSQMGKAIGDGVKAAKSGVKFAQQKMNDVMDLYNQGMTYVEEAKNSPEYKAMQISYKIKKLQDEKNALLQEQKKAQEETEAQIDLVQQEADAKIRNLNKNLDNMKVLMADGDDENAKMEVEKINSEINRVKENLAQRVSALQAQLPAQEITSSAKLQTAVQGNIWETGSINKNDMVEQNQDDVISGLRPGTKLEKRLSQSSSQQFIQKGVAAKNTNILRSTVETSAQAEEVSRRRIIK